MKKFLLFVGAISAGIGVANAAARDATSINRQSGTPSAISTTTRNDARTAIARTGATVSRTAQPTSRGATARNTVARSTSPQSRTTAARDTTVARSARNAQSSYAKQTSARAAVTIAENATSNTFGTGYNACRDAYFTCMDQFCAKQDDTYRRCVCSSKLNTIKSRERQLSQTSDQLQDFKDLNIDVIPKTGAEVKAMLSATDGEKTAATTKDTSDSSKKLAGISAVLSSTKSKALSTQGTLDIAGDINAIWATTDLASGAQIANLTGESLYNAVHGQCADLIYDKCPSVATLNMVVSAYAMYIENDCATLSAALDKKFTAANAAIRATESEMHAARLENYDAHNSTSINDCIAQVRKDITSNSACGADYVHCLDVSGRYLNRDTGEPIYTSEFYQLETAISLNGDILNNQTNRMIVNELNNKRVFAKRGLETCRDLADEVWDEFMRQAITEIYQGQHERIRQVKNECLDVVTTCYDTQSQSLKDFSNVKEQLLLGSRLELAEEMCQDKLQACANLYGGGPQGMQELISAMTTITDQQIAMQCQTTLTEYAKEKCGVSSKDSLHSYPFGCRTYTPGGQYYVEMCHITYTEDCESNICTSCANNYYLAQSATNATFNKNGGVCTKCTDTETYKDCICPGGANAPICNIASGTNTATLCDDYNNSLYRQLVSYAQQTCVRPSAANDPLPSNILQDINVVMDSIRIDMARELAKECERLGGIWVDTEHETASTTTRATSQNKAQSTGTNDSIYDKKTHELHEKFYNETSANIKWGYCAADDDDEDE